jgi:hypothetical protein
MFTDPQHWKNDNNTFSDFLFIIVTFNRCSGSGSRQAKMVTPKKEETKKFWGVRKKIMAFLYRFFKYNFFHKNLVGFRMDVSGDLLLADSDHPIFLEL